MRQVLVALMIVCSLVLTPSAHAVNVEKIVSQGGISAWLVRDHQNPIINMRIAFRGGAALDPAGKGGLANLVSALLDEGAGNMPIARERIDNVDHQTVISNSFGFGGTNSTLLFQRWEDK
mgnify:CR=1 FL=1